MQRRSQPLNPMSRDDLMDGAEPDDLPLRSRTNDEAAQFHAFGYIVIRQCLDSEHVAALQNAHTCHMANAASHDYFGTSGTRMTRRFFNHHPAFGALVEHPSVMAMMRDIDGTEFLFSGGGSSWSNFDGTPMACQDKKSQAPRSPYISTSRMRPPVPCG